MPKQQPRLQLAIGVIILGMIVATASSSGYHSPKSVSPELGASDVTRIVSTSRTNDLAFERDFKGRTFSGVSSLRTIQKLLFNVYTVELHGAFDATCMMTLLPKGIADWPEGTPVHVTAIIDGTTGRTLKLENCSLEKTTN